jgi:hypothetical protein
VTRRVFLENNAFAPVTLCGKMDGHARPMLMSLQVSDFADSTTSQPIQRWPFSNCDAGTS